MKQTRVVALSRHTAPSFVMLGGLELLQLRKLPWLARSLFIELLAMADHKDGRIRTTYAVLLALLDFDQADCAHAPEKPTLRRLRTAIEQLQALDMVEVDRAMNERAKGLFFRLRSREGISSTGAKKGRLSDRPLNGGKRALARLSRASAADERQTERQGVQERDISPCSPLLSTGPAPIRSLLDGMKDRLAKDRESIARAPAARARAPQKSKRVLKGERDGKG